MRGARSPYALVVVAALAWALIAIWATELLDAGLSSSEIGFWRALIGAACFAAHARVTRRALVRSDLVPQALFGIVGVGFFYVSLPQAIDAGGVGLAFVLLYTAPAFVLVADAVTHRRLDLRITAALTVALVGVGMVASASTTGTSGGALAWGLASGATYATHYLIGRSRHAGDEVIRYAVAMTAGAVVIAPTVDWTPKSASSWLFIAAIGVVSTYLPFLALSTALTRIESARAALVAMIEPVAAVAIGAAVYAEDLTPGRVAGGVLVLAAAAAAIRLQPTPPGTAAVISA